MAIENKYLFITKEEFKDSNFYDEDLFGNKDNPNEATNDKTIDLAIDMASNNIDYLSGFSITEKWPEESETDWTQNIKLATAHYVRYALTKGVDYIRGQQSLSISGISESINNPEDPYFIPPDVFNYLRKCKEYKSFKGYELQGVVPNRNNSLFSKFGSNCNEDSPWNRYLKIVNLLQGEGIIIDITHPSNILGPVITISFDKSLIPNITEDRIFSSKFLKEVTEKITDIINPNTLYKHIDYKYNPSFDNFTDDTLIPKKYVDNKIPDVTNFVLKNEVSNALGYYNKSYQLKNNVQMFELNKTLEKWIDDKIASSGGTSYIQGEYKYMDFNINEMPSGWKKITTSEKTSNVLWSHDDIDKLSYKINSATDSYTTINMSTQALANLGQLYFNNQENGQFNIYLTSSKLYKYDPQNIYSDLEDKIYIGDEAWKNFEATRIQHKEMINLDL